MFDSQETSHLQWLLPDQHAKTSLSKKRETPIPDIGALKKNGVRQGRLSTAHPHR